jgi:hypothetical protein
MLSNLAPVAPSDIKPGLVYHLLDTVAEQSTSSKTYKLLSGLITTLFDIGSCIKNLLNVIDQL